MEYIKHEVIVPPEAEPIGIGEVEMHLRLIPDGQDEYDAIIGPLITAAREYCENITGRALAPQTVLCRITTPMLHAAILPKPPIIDIESVTAYRQDGTALTLENGWFFDGFDGAINITNMPAGLRDRNPIEIRYRAGYERIPLPIRQAMLLMIGHWYENREAVVVGAAASVEVSLTVRTLLNQYKVWWF